MSNAAENIRRILEILTESQQLLLEDPLNNILRDAKCGNELLKLIRSYRAVNHDADFQEVPFSFFMDADQFSGKKIGIVIGETGSAMIRPGRNTMRRFLIRGFEQKAKLKSEYFSSGETGTLLHFITNVKKCYVTVDPRPQRPELDIRAQNARDEYFDEEIAAQRIFQKIKPVLIPIIKKSFLDIQHHFKNAIEDGDYQTAQMYSTAAEKSKKFLVLLDRAEDVNELPGLVDGFDYRRTFTNSIRQAFTDMHKKFPPYDLLPHSEEDPYETDSRESYTEFLKNAFTNIGAEVKYIIKRIKENCLTG